MANVHTVSVGASATTRTIAARLADCIIRTVNHNDESLEKVVARLTPSDISFFTQRDLKAGEFEVIKTIASRIAERELSA